MKFNKNITNKILYMTDIVNLFKRYLENLDSYYYNYDNRYKDPIAFDYYSELKEECLSLAKKRGVLDES